MSEVTQVHCDACHAFTTKSYSLLNGWVKIEVDSIGQRRPTVIAHLCPRCHKELSPALQFPGVDL
jgi:hypothetical protein